ncbi:Ornithine decarboxylase antizyme, putative [Brugia malayi]|uniref:Ornithine decarboxylase antizyme n=1 Tax=Brugia malayi TaxID=6279 RepID=A0A4E9FWN2_BRUMA|nr:Ornithine decarboxylase antizyme, putative [Brugia malayi]VIO97283.1 Ornithine decarboxylase antizyme, putative [Brugia malayi]
MGRVRHADVFFAETVNVATWASSVIPDVPTGGLFNDEHIHSLESFVNEVSSDWCCHLVEGNTLAIFLPFDQRTWNLSKGAFVSLFEFCEDNLPVKRILLCLNKTSVDETVASCFKYLGFNPLHPHSYPSCIDPQGVFAMVYNI